MRKQLHIITSEQGFYIPYVLMIAILSISILTTSLIFYQHEQKITSSLLQQTEIETLIQMGRAQFKKDRPYLEQENGNIEYIFPNGSVRLIYAKTNTDQLALTFHVKTKTDFPFEITHTYTIRGEQ